MNVAMIGIQKKNKLKDSADEVKEGEMPIRLYRIAHPEVHLSNAEKKELTSELEKTFRVEEEKERKQYSLSPQYSPPSHSILL